MGKLFGTDGIRGEAGRFPLDRETVRAIGGSLAVRAAEATGRGARIVTGRDTRESGEWIEAELHSGARSAGAECVSAGVITTPGVAFVTAEFALDLGVVISASHNPFYDNGIKAFLPNGMKIDDEFERLIESDIEAGQAKGEGDVHPPRTDHRYRQVYFDHLTSFGPDLSGYKIAVDCANGAAFALAPALFRALGADVVSLNEHPNGRNINENCGSLHLEQLQEKVAAVNADLGVAFDGDADRALFVDEEGSVVDGDATLWIMAKAMQERGELPSGKVVATVMSNIGLEIALRSRGIDLIRTSVGDKYVLEALIRSGSEIGGEQSGHIIFPAESRVGDGMVTALRLFGAVKETGKTFSEAVEGFVRYPQVLVNVRVAGKKPFDDVDEIRETAAEVEKILAGNGRLLLRYSGTENLARVMIEGRDQSEIEELAGRLAKSIEKALT